MKKLYALRVGGFPFCKGELIISSLGQGRLGGAGGRDGSNDMIEVTCAPRGVVQSLENGKTYNNIANISETPFLPKERKNSSLLRQIQVYYRKQHIYDISS